MESKEASGENLVVDVHNLFTNIVQAVEKKLIDDLIID